MDPDVDVFVDDAFSNFLLRLTYRQNHITLETRRDSVVYVHARNSQFLRCIVVSSPSAWRGKTLPEDGDRREGRADGTTAGGHETSVAVVTLN